MFYSSNETSANNQYNIIKNATFTPINETFQFPKCRRQCKNFYIGRSDFTVVNASIEIRAGDKAEFACKPGYYIIVIRKLFSPKFCQNSEYDQFFCRLLHRG